MKRYEYKDLVIAIEIHKDSFVFLYDEMHILLDNGFYKNSSELTAFKDAKNVSDILSVMGNKGWILRCQSERSEGKYIFKTYTFGKTYETD